MHLSQEHASSCARDKGIDDCIQWILIFQKIEWLGIRKRVIFRKYGDCGMGWRPGFLVNFPTFCVVEVILKLGADCYLKSFFQRRLDLSAIQKNPFRSIDPSARKKECVSGDTLIPVVGAVVARPSSNVTGARNAGWRGMPPRRCPTRGLARGRHPGPAKPGDQSPGCRVATLIVPVGRR
ncbi:hypothetical protein [Ralstonia pseudosolanacearum]